MLRKSFSLLSLSILFAQLGMGVVSVSSTAARTPLGLSTKLLTHRCTVKRPLIVAFKGDKSNNRAWVAPHEQIPLPIEAPNEHKKRVRRGSKSFKRAKAAFTDEASPCTVEVDYNEAAAKLENLYKLSPEFRTSNMEDKDRVTKRGRSRRKRDIGGDEKVDNVTTKPVVRNVNTKPKRLGLDRRIELRKNENKEVVVKSQRKKNEDEKIERLVRDYSSSTDLVSLDWKKMKIPPVLSSSEHTWLFKLMQPMKASTYPFSFVLFKFLNQLIAHSETLLFLNVRLFLK